MDWIGLDWIGLDWVEILEKNDGLDWIGSKVLYIKVLRPSTITAPLQFWKDQAKQYPILSTVMDWVRILEKRIWIGWDWVRN